MIEMKTDLLTPEQVKIFNAINNAEHGITREKLLLALGKEEKDARKLLEEIHFMITKRNIPIGSTSNSKLSNGKYTGYFICKTPEDFEIAKQTLSSRVNGINRRVRALNKLKGASI